MLAVDKVGAAKVFVAHRETGVRLIPANWLDAWRPSGFREATAVEVARWYETRGFDVPLDVQRAAAAESEATDEEYPVRAITLPANAQPGATPPA